MKILNLEKLSASEERVLKVGDKEYPVSPMTVSNFIETTRAAEKLESETSVVAQVEATVEMVLRSVPTITRDVLDQLSLEQLQAIVAFVRGDDVDGVESESGAKK